MHQFNDIIRDLSSDKNISTESAESTADYEDFKDTVKFHRDIPTNLKSTYDNTAHSLDQMLGPKEILSTGFRKVLELTAKI